MYDNQSLSHTMWECKYHLACITKSDYHSFSAKVKRRIGMGGVRSAMYANRGIRLSRSKRRLKRY